MYVHKERALDDAVAFWFIECEGEHAFQEIPQRVVRCMHRSASGFEDSKERNREEEKRKTHES